MTNIEKDVDDIMAKNGNEIITIKFEDLIQINQKPIFGQYESFFVEMAFITLLSQESIFNSVIKQLQTYCDNYVVTMNDYCNYSHVNLEIELFGLQLDKFMDHYSFIFDHLIRKGEEFEIIDVYKKFENHFTNIAKRDVDKVFDDTIMFIKTMKFTVDIDIISNDIERVIVKKLPRKNKWNKVYCEEYGDKVADVANVIMNKITEMNSKFALTQNTYNERLRIFCEELSVKSILLQMFEHVMVNNRFDLQQIPFFTDYDLKYSKYVEPNVHCDQSKQNICLHTIGIISRYMASMVDFYTYTVSFDISDSNFIHAIEDTNIGNDLHIYFSDMYVVDNKNECISKIKHRQVLKQVLDNKHFSRFYFIYTAFMTEYLQVKTVSLTLLQAMAHSSENKFSMLFFDDEFKQFPSINDLSLRERDNLKNLYIGNDGTIIRLLHNIVYYKNKSEFINDHVITIKRDKDCNIQEYKLSIDNITHRSILDHYVRTELEKLYN